MLPFRAIIIGRRQGMSNMTHQCAQQIVRSFNTSSEAAVEGAAVGIGSVSLGVVIGAGITSLVKGEEPKPN